MFLIFNRISQNFCRKALCHTHCGPKTLQEKRSMNSNKSAKHAISLLGICRQDLFDKTFTILPIQNRLPSFTGDTAGNRPWPNKTIIITPIDNFPNAHVCFKKKILGLELRYRLLRNRSAASCQIGHGFLSLINTH